MSTQSIPTSKHAHTRQSFRGQVMILFAVGVVVLIGGAALAVDVGFLMAERRQNQAAVDAAALSAAKAVLDKKSSTIVQNSGKLYGAENADVPQADVNVQWPAPGTGPRTGDEFVRVTITKDVQKFFLGALYGGDWQVTNTAVAGLDDVQKPYALVALNCPGIALNGSIQIHISGGGSAISNCNITNSGSSSLFAVGGSIDAVGTIESNESWSAPDGINENENAAPDPLAGATKPSKPAEVTLPSCLTSNDDFCTISPGSYTNKSFTVKNAVCMQPGLYYLDGNTQISFQNTNSVLTDKSPHAYAGTGPKACPSSLGSGGGVLIYIAEGSTARITMGNGKLDISTSYPAQEPLPDPMPETGPCNPSAAPYTGATCGMALWIDNGQPFNSSGNARAKFGGVIYAPDSHVTLQGTPGSSGLQVIVGQLTMGGTADFNIEYRQYVQVDRPAVFLVE